MLVESYTLSEILRSRPDRAIGAVFKHNGKAYCLRQSASGQENGISVSYLAADGRSLTAARLTEAVRRSADVPRQLLGTYTLYNGIGANGNLTVGGTPCPYIPMTAGFMRKQQTSYMHFNTINSFSCSTPRVAGQLTGPNGNPNLIVNEQHIEDVRLIAQSVDTVAIMRAVQSLYPDDLQVAAFLLYAVYSDYDKTTVAISPNCMLSFQQELESTGLVEGQVVYTMLFSLSTYDVNTGTFTNYPIVFELVRATSPRRSTPPTALSVTVRVARSHPFAVDVIRSLRPTEAELLSTVFTYDSSPP